MWQPTHQVLHAGQHACSSLSLVVKQLDMQDVTIKHVALWDAWEWPQLIMCGAVCLPLKVSLFQSTQITCGPLSKNNSIDFSFGCFVYSLI